MSFNVPPPFICSFLLNPQGRDNLTHEKERFAHEHPQMKKLEDVVRELKPTAIIGKTTSVVVCAYQRNCIVTVTTINAVMVILRTWLPGTTL